MSRSRTKLQPGSAAPSFELLALNDEEVSLFPCLLEGPVLIEFIRGTWCPNARKRLQQLADARSRFRALWTRILVVVCEDPSTVRRYFERRPSPLTVLLDAERRAARDYGVYVKFGLDGWNIARPASFLVDRAGFVRYAFVAALQTETCPLTTLYDEIERFERERELPEPAGGED